MENQSKPLSAGRWKKEETEILLSTVNELLQNGIQLSAACYNASTKIHRSADACYQKWLYEQMRAQGKKKKRKGQKTEADLLTTIDQEADTSKRQISIPIPKNEGQKLIITVQLG